MGFSQMYVCLDFGQQNTHFIRDAFSHLNVHVCTLYKHKHQWMASSHTQMFVWLWMDVLWVALNEKTTTTIAALTKKWEVIIKCQQFHLFNKLFVISYMKCLFSLTLVLLLFSVHFYFYFCFRFISFCPNKCHIHISFVHFSDKRTHYTLTSTIGKKRD